MDLSGKPAVILVIGVNGVGKTTSIAKLADHYTREQKGDAGRRRYLPCRSQRTAGDLGRPRRCAHCERRRGRRPGGCHFRHRKVCHRTRL